MTDYEDRVLGVGIFIEMFTITSKRVNPRCTVKSNTKEAIIKGTTSYEYGYVHNGSNYDCGGYAKASGYGYGVGTGSGYGNKTGGAVYMYDSLSLAATTSMIVPFEVKVDDCHR